jgi:hypothetical protein
MKRENKEVFGRVIGARARRLDCSREQVLESLTGAPSFLGAPGSDTSVLDGDLLRLWRSPYPLPECLMPYEVEELPTLDDERVTHARSCAFCSSLLAAIEPDPRRLGQFLLRAKAVSRDVVAERKQKIA